jgi:hypothetical protein
MNLNFFDHKNKTGLLKDPSFLILNLFILTLLFLLFCFPWLIGNVLYYRDISHNYYPILEFMKESLHQGDMPFWNPFLFMGVPQMAALEPPLFYPLAWSFFIFDFSTALTINLCLHYLLATWGMFFLLRTYRLVPVATIYGALVWGMGGLLISLNSMHPLLNTVIWIPWLFLCFRYYQGADSSFSRVKWGLGLSCVLGLQILSGHLEIVYLSGLTLAVYSLRSVISKQITVSTLFLFVIFVGLGIGTACIQILPSLMYSSESVREAGITLFQAQQFSFHPLHLPGLLVPGFLGDSTSVLNLKPILGEPQLGYNLLLPSVYLGVGTLFLACFGGFKKEHDSIFWAGLALLTLLCAFGKYFYAYALLWSYIPGFSLFRYPEKILFFTSFACVLLSAFGVDRLYLSPWLATRQRFYSVFGIGGALLGGGYLFRQSILSFLARSYPSKYPYVQDFNGWFETNQIALGHSFLMALVLLLCLAILIYFFKREQLTAPVFSFLFLVLVSGDLFYNAKSQVWFVDKSFYEIKSETARFLENHLSAQDYYLVENNEDNLGYFLLMYKDQPLLRSELFGVTHLKDNFGMLYHLKSAFGFLPLRPWRAEMFNTAYAQHKIKAPAFASTYMSLLSVKYRVLVNPTPSELARVKQDVNYQQVDYFSETQSYAFENKRVLPRVRFQHQSVLVGVPEDAFRVWSDPESLNYLPQERVILVDSPAFQQAQKQVPSQEAAQKEWTSPEIYAESNQALAIRFSTNTSGYLVLGDQYMPGWKAYDNGKLTPILQANFLQRAIRVGPGEHEVHFVYEPPGFALGWKLSLLSGLLGLLIFLWGWRSRNSIRLPVEMAL